MKADDDEFDGPPAETPVPQRAPRPGKNGVNGVAYSREAEEYLLSSVFMDGEEVFPQCLAAHLSAESFHLPAHQTIFECVADLHARRKPLTLDVVAESLRSRKLLEQMGGFAFLSEISSRIPTTAQASFFIEQVRDYELQRRFDRLAKTVVERGAANQEPGGFTAILGSAMEELSRLAAGVERANVKSFADFRVPPPGDRSILLGNRYLNRGDGGILSSTSGVGKSSIALQMAASWALGRPFMGMPSNGKLTSLIVQAEDSEGDIGEVWASIAAKMALTPEEIAEVRKRVIVVTNRTKRGPHFITWLRGLTAKYAPDIVFLNPLQAFLAGDITKGEDLGAFLREGLNSVNESGNFGFILIHHTTKPAADPKERMWHEVMYDMAGGAELINWARFIISIRPREEFGSFSMVLAKRGSRAGITKDVPQGAGFRTEVVLTVPIKYAGGTVDAGGITIPAIYWEQDGEGAAKISAEAKPAGAARARLSFADAKSLFPVGKDKAVQFQVIARGAKNKLVGTSQAAFTAHFKEWIEAGTVKTDSTKVNEPRYYVED